MSALRERWAREDAFIGPRLPSASNRPYWEARDDRVVLSCRGWWWAKPLDQVGAQGPYDTIIEARHAPLSISA
jgi:hypothetical protein